MKFPRSRKQHGCLLQASEPRTLHFESERAALHRRCALALAFVGISCAARIKYTGPLAVLPDPVPRVVLPIRDPLAKPELSVYGTLTGPSGEHAGVWFTVDSGCSNVNVPPALARTLKLRELGRARVETPVGHNEDESIAVAPRLDLAGLAASDVLLGTTANLAVLGQSVLGHSPWEVSWTRGTLTLGVTPWPITSDVTVVRLRADKQHRVDHVDAFIDGHPVSMLLDTGAAVSALPARLNAALHLPTRPFKAAISTGGGVADVRSAVTARLELGPLRLDQTTFALVPGEGTHALLGLDVLSRFDFQVLPGARLLLRPRGPLRASARERTERWPWLPRGCANVGCLRARIANSGTNSVIEVQREAPLPAPAQFVLACADPERVPPAAALVQLLTVARLPLPFRRIILRLSATAPATLSTPLAFADRLWFSADGSGCRNLEVLDVFELPKGEPTSGQATAQISP